ncbi:MAG: hypothetical protein CMK30_00925 [Porticoccaceae bacterium]|nr:hypothetical protein [Porticoccaceae bacterium]|tara:strand:+ start:50347 stop:51204 length:858 start_codon:yes stop_codon:yes gene_type:complete
MLKLMLFGPLLAFGILSELGICQELRAFNDNDAETIIIERNNIDSTNENEYDEDFDFKTLDESTESQARSNADDSQSAIGASNVHHKRGYISDVYYVPVRSVPNKNGKVTLNGLKSGTPVTVIDNDGQWKKILTDFGQQGWIEKRFISESPISATLLTEEREAKKILEQMLKEEQSTSERLKNALALKNDELKSLALNHKNQVKKATSTNDDATNPVTGKNIQRLVERNHLLIQENDVLKAQLQSAYQNDGRQFFLYGGILVFLGALLTALIPKIRGRRRLSNWQ